MAEQVCVVCNVPVPADAPHLGGRIYCETHFNKVTKHRNAVWISTLAAILGLLLFVVVVRLVAPANVTALGGMTLLAIGLVFALVPAALWLIVFYLQDRLEPEPKGYVMLIFLLGAGLAFTIGIPVVRNLLPLPAAEGLRSTRDVVIAIAHSILIVGFVQEYLKYAAVRYTIFRSAEFDERTDGIVYGAAAGLGFAAAINAHYIVTSGGLLLGQAALRSTITALAQASFSGVMGYFLGRAKFEKMGKAWLPLGLVLAATLNGTVAYALVEVSAAGLSYTPIRGLILAAVVALLTFGAVLALIRRANALTLASA